MFVGVIIGTGLKFYLEYLREKGVINRKGVAVFVSVTVLVGIVITVIAWAGQIQIIAFKDIHLSTIGGGDFHHWTDRRSGRRPLPE